MENVQDKQNKQQGNWYAVQVMAGREVDICKDFKDVLSVEHYQHCFVPMAEYYHRKEGKSLLFRKPLFPGYFFIVSDYIDEVVASINKISKFKKILKTGDCYVPLTEEEAEVFRSLTDKAFNITMSKGFIIGDAITITEGPLKGHEGKIKKIDRHKRIAIISMPFIGKETSARVPLEIVDKR